MADHTKAIEACKDLAERAKAAETALCINGHPVFWYEYDIPLIEGHIYSHSGRDEFCISQCCEYCFDKMFAEEDDPSREVMGGNPVFG